MRGRSGSSGSTTGPFGQKEVEVGEEAICLFASIAASESEGFGFGLIGFCRGFRREK